VSRIAHAVAHLTQAGISLQRWNHQLNQQAGERARPETGSKVRGGLSPQTSQALRNALLGIAPFDAEKIGPPKPVPDEREPSLLTISRVVDEVREPQKSNATAAADALKRGDQFDNEDDL
jgi:hypothetical protein